MLLLPPFTIGCGDDTAARLTASLAPQGIKNVDVTDERIVASCALGQTAELPAAELERNFMGMAKASKVTSVGRALLKECDDKDNAQRKAEGLKVAIADEAKRLGITAGADDDATKNAICDKLTSTLPISAADRTDQGLKNTARWGCATPPPVEELKTGAWIVEHGKPVGKKPGTHFLRLQNGDGEKLTFSCTGKKTTFYVQPKLAAPKKTTILETQLDAAKAAKWKVRPSTDGKALFFIDVKAAARGLSEKNAATFIPAGKKATSSTFNVSGFKEAFASLPPACR